MELFPAADEEQWEFIKRVIGDCDYYLLIIGGRYGTLTSEGISYTEKEYDYAVSIGLKVLAFLHDAPDNIPLAKSEIDLGLREKLEAFRTKCSQNRLVKFWRSAEELPGMVALSLINAIKLYPAVGWVRANYVANDELLSDLNNLRKENEQLRKDGSQSKSRVPWRDVLSLAALGEIHTLALEFYPDSGIAKRKETLSSTWAEIFAILAPYIVAHPSDLSVQRSLASELYRKHFNRSPYPVELPMAEFHTIRTQFCALDLVQVSYLKSTDGKMALFWSLTERGTQTMMELRTIRPNTSKTAEANG
jgi:hypothetical protein